MSQDQKPGKVKLYSGGSGNKPTGVRAVSGASGAQDRGAGAGGDGAAPAVALPAPEEATRSGPSLLVLMLFVLGCALGGGLFTAFMPF
jgi:hypothetical protein